MAKTTKIKSPKTSSVKTKISKRNSSKRVQLKHIPKSEMLRLSSNVNGSLEDIVDNSKMVNDVDEISTNAGGLFVKAPDKPIRKEHIKLCVEALLRYVEIQNVGKTELFDDEQPVFMQLVVIKIPKSPHRQIRFTLAHSLFSDTSEICLIVKDLHRPKDHESTINHYENILQKNKIRNIKVMPFNQLKNEFGKEFELKRTLLGLYDCILVDGKLSCYVTHYLGKIFMNKRILPIPVKMQSTNLKQHFDNSLKKAAMKVHANGDTFLIQVGHTKMDKFKIVDNILSLVDDLDVEFPGGFDNLRSLGLKTENSICVPFYYTLKMNREVDIPVIIAKRPKAYQTATGELTTFYKKTVTVLPSGDVKVDMLVDSGSEDDFDNLDERDEVLKSPEAVAVENDGRVENTNNEDGKDENDQENSEEENNEISLEQVEENYLKEATISRRVTRKKKVEKVEIKEEEKKKTAVKKIRKKQGKKVAV